MNKVLLLGANSDISRAMAEQIAASGKDLVLAARKGHELEPMQKDLQIRYGVNVALRDFDASQVSAHRDWVNALPDGIDTAVIVFGYLGDQEKASVEWQEAEKIIMSNYTGAVSIGSALAEYFIRHGKGMIVGISSVAGERGRGSNFYYGSAKAGFSTWLSGLRNSLYSKGIHVMTVKPGFMDTKMTAGLDLPPALTSSPEKAAKQILRGIRKKKNVIYVSPIWAIIMLVIKLIPESIFKRLKL